MAYNQLGQWAGPHAGYYNEAGEPIMDAAAARFEAALDEQAQQDAWFDNQDDEQERADAFWEDLYDQQSEGQCPACGETDCDLDIKYNFGQRVAYHKVTIA